MKKILAFILALAMIFTMGTAVFADETATPAPTQDPSKGSITVYNPTVGHQYDAYKLFDLTQNGDKVAYTYTRTDADTDVLFNKLNENASPFSLTATTVPGTYNVTKKDKSVITPATETEPEEAIIWTDEKVIEWLKGLFTYEEQVEKEISYQNPAKAYTMTFEVDPQTHETKEFTVWNDKDNKWYKEEVDAQGATKLEKFTPSQTQLDNKQPVMQDLVPPEYGYATPVATHTATDNKPFTFMNLDLGYYFVTSSLGAAVTINSTLPNVTVIDKNENDDWDYPPTEPGQPNVGKAIVENELVCGKEESETHTHTADCYDDVFKKVNSANYGDTVRFSIGVNGKSFDTDENLVTYYWITDTLQDGFDVLDKDGALINNLKVKIDGVELTKVAKADLDLTSDTNQYAITYSNTGSGTDSRKFEIVIPVIKATEVKDDPEDPEKITKYKYDSRYDSNFQIEVTYEAVVNKNAVIAGDGNKNTANFYPQTMEFDPDDPYEPPYQPPTPPGEPQPPVEPPTTPEDPTYDSNNKRETVTYVYALGMLKVDEQGEKLAGAKFTITNEDGDKIYAVKQADGTYKYESDSTATGRTDEFEVVATGNDKGELVIKGLKAGKYTVTETDAPDGYNILGKPFVIEAVLQATYTEKITTYYDKEITAEDKKVVEEVTEYYEETATDVKVVPQVVINKAGAELPQTGGMGTTIFYVIGAILALGAVVLLIARKRTTD